MQVSSASQNSISPRVNADSLSFASSQLWSEADAEVRKAYYDRNAIGWVARPKHGKDGFIRKGRFKKVRLPLFASSSSVELMLIIRSSGSTSRPRT
jgi:hypothetical protein